MMKKLLASKRDRMAIDAAEKIGLKVKSENDLFADLVIRHNWRGIALRYDDRAKSQKAYFRGCALPKFAIGITPKGVLAHTPEYPAPDDSRKEITSLVVHDPDFTVKDYWDSLDAQKSEQSRKWLA